MEFEELDEKFKEILMELPSSCCIDIYNTKKVIFKTYDSYTKLMIDFHDKLKYKEENMFFLPCMYYHTPTEYKFFMMTFIINSRKTSLALNPVELGIFLSKKF